MNKTAKILISLFVIATIAGCGGTKGTEPQTSTEAQPKITEPVQTEKTFEGDKFSFIYPAKYTTDEKGLWTEEGYKNHTNPLPDCDLCQIPAIEITSVTTDNTIDQQIIADFDLPGATLEEMSEQTSIPYEEKKIGENSFIKIKVSEMIETTAYYTKKNDTIVSFKIFGVNNDEQEVENIISTLEFK
jgi:hypothetical protein